MMHYWGQPIYRGYGFGGTDLIGLLLTVLFWGAVFFLFVMLIKGFHKENSESEKDTGGALDILKERYAKGEIDKKKFDEMKKDILRKD